MVLSTDALNYSTEALRRVDWKFGIAYGDDGEFQRAINDFIARQPNFKRPVTLLVSELGDSSILL
jgi:small conductance mechanosensitive channel